MSNGTSAWRTSAPIMALLVVSASLFSLPSHGQAGLTPARYFDCQLAARQATLAGLKERAALVQQKASISDQTRADDRARLQVSQAYARCGYTANALAAYAYRSDDSLRAWLAANPATQAQLTDLSAQLASTSAQVPAQRAPQAATPNKR